MASCCRVYRVDFDNDFFLVSITIHADSIESVEHQLTLYFGSSVLDHVVYIYPISFN